MLKLRRNNVMYGAIRRTRLEPQNRRLFSIDNLLLIRLLTH